MIRLWHRVGIFRALSILVLIASLVGGFLLSDRQSQQHRKLTAVNYAGAAPASNESEETRQLQRKVNDDRTAALREAQAKADEAARLEAERAAKAADEARRTEAANRSKARTADPSAKPSQAASPPAKGGTGSTIKLPPAPADCSKYTGNRAIGCTLLLANGYGIDQMGCLDDLWNKESKWSTSAHNGSSGAHGIPQALPPTKMKSAGPNYMTDAATQITWGLGYIKSRYGSPCAAYAHSKRTGWY